MPRDDQRKDAVKLWHTLRRETSGACRSVRYDLDSHRAARLAGAFTKELEPSSRPDRSRLVPFTGVTLLLASGAAGACLAISSGLSTLTADSPPLGAQPPLTAASDSPAPAQPTVSGPPPTRPVTPRRPGSRASAVPPAPVVVVVPASPVLESAPATPSASPSESPDPSISPHPSETPSESPNESSTRAPRPRR
jgi:hypothetical protein